MLLKQLTRPTGILSLSTGHLCLVCWNGSNSLENKAADGDAKIVLFVRQKLNQKSGFNLCRTWPNLTINLASSTSSTAL